jgi:hypothetical protein
MTSRNATNPMGFSKRGYHIYMVRTDYVRTIRMTNRHRIVLRYIGSGIADFGCLFLVKTSFFIPSLTSVPVDHTKKQFARTVYHHQESAGLNHLSSSLPLSRLHPKLKRFAHHDDDDDDEDENKPLLLCCIGIFSCLYRPPLLVATRSPCKSHPEKKNAQQYFQWYFFFCRRSFRRSRIVTSMGHNGRSRSQGQQASKSSGIVSIE